jgi:tetratricopeptide (TPR) repeat protein
MNKFLLALGLLLVVASLGAGWWYWAHYPSLPSQLARARTILGTDEGRALLERLAERYPDNAEVQFLLARQLDLQGENALAKIALERAAALGWPRPEVDRWRWLLISRREFRRAEPYLQSRLDTEPEDRDALLALAAGYRDLNRQSMAEQLVNRALNRNPDDGPALYLRGKIRMRAGRMDVAYDDLAQSVALGKDQFYALDARLQMALCLRSLQQFEKAYKVYQDLRALLPESPAVLYGLGVCARSLDRLDEAMESFEHLLRIRPGDSEALLEMANVYEDRKEHDKALEVLRKVESSYPEDLQLLSQMAKTLQAMGDSDRAAEYRQRYDNVEKSLQEKSKRHNNDETAPSAPQP